MLATSEMIDENQHADKQAVIRHCEGTVIEGRMPDHEASIEYAAQIGLLEIRGKHVSITEEGSAFLELNPGKLYDLSDGQKRFLLRACYLHGPFREDCLKVLSNFSASYSKGTYRWSWVDSPALEGGEFLLEQLRELGLVAREEYWYEVNAEFVDTIATFLAEGKGFTEERFLEYLREKEEIGKIAESLVLESEAQRLRKAGHVAEAMSIRSISRLRVNAGYDIESFDGRSLGVSYDRFIEVKGAKGSKVHFFWSDNEIKVAEELGNKYWIYFQGGIDVDSMKAKNKLLTFQDPVETILNDAKFTKTPHGIIIEAALRGRILAV